jgi:phosphatidate cytidylyltransferase
MKQLLLLYTVLFVIGAVGNYFSILKHQASSKKAWTKYFIYLIVVLVNTIIFSYSNYYFKLAYILILTSFSIKELWQACKPKKLWLLFILACISLSLALFSFMNQISEVLISTYVTVLVFDGFSQIGGQLFGKKKLVKHISPNKTIGGLIIGGSSALLCFLIFHYAQSISDFKFIYYFSFCCCSILGGFLGDLGASYIKRRTAIKDFASYIPAHGGVLDRMDSYLGALITVGIFLLFK